MILLWWRTDWAHWLELTNKCCAHGIACFEHDWKVLFTCEKLMPYAAFSIGLLLNLLLVTLWYLDNMQLFKGQIHRWNNNKMVAPVLVKNWGMGLEKCNHSKINRQSYGCKDWPSQIIVWTMLWNSTVFVYIYNVYKHWEKNKLIFWVLLECDSWTKLMRHLCYILQESMYIYIYIQCQSKVWTHLHIPGLFFVFKMFYIIE